MALYERLLGRSDTGGTVEGHIPVHQFQALLAEFARGRLTGAQANAAIEAMTGLPLDVAERAEVTALLATVVGSGVAKLARSKEIDDVLLLATGKVPVAGYATPSQVKARLGV